MNEEKRKTDAADRLLHYLSQNHLRCTSERMVLLEKVTAMKGCFSPAELMLALADSDFRLSQGTVYNTLRLFEAAGVVRRRPGEHGAEVYECASRVDEHIILCCTRCGRRREVKDAELLRILKLRRYPSFVASGFDLYIHGLCSRCRGGGRVRKDMTQPSQKK